MGKVLAERERLDVSRLPRLEAGLEAARRAALTGERVWEDAALCRELCGARSGRWRSPDVPIWGSWLPSAQDASVGDAPPQTAREDGPTSEFEAAPVDGLRVREEASGEPEEPAPIVPFERVETLDSYRGSARDLDGSDELEAHLDALEQVELGDLFRGSQGAQSLLKADLEIGRDLADAAGTVGRGGIPYDEWDARSHRYRKAWCTVFPGCAKAGDARWARETLGRHRRVVDELQKRLEAHRAGLRQVPRRPDGERIDLQAAIDYRVAQLAGRSASPLVYERSERRRRNFATTVLLDVSMSSDSWVDGRRVLDVSREATLILGEVAHRLGERCQVLAFASETRNRCSVLEVAGFGEEWAAARRRLSALQPQGYTRIGPALRHATAQLLAEPAERRMLLLVSDGKPTDFDRYEGRYGIADVRQALREARRHEVRTHALAVDHVARDYLPALFGVNGWHLLPRPEDLPDVATAVYARMAAG